MLGVRVTKKAKQAGTTLEVSDPERLTLLAHDIRSTLADVLGSLRLIEVSEQAPQGHEQLDRARKAADQLARLLEDALAAVAGEEHVVRFNPPPIDVARLLQGIARQWAATAQDISPDALDIRFVARGPLPQAAALDRLALERVLRNLFSNALRYVKRGHVLLEGWLDSDDTLHITLADDGPGFGPGQIAALASLPEVTFSAGEPGSGFGSRIAQDLVRRMGGRISFANRPEGGAIITLRFTAEAWRPDPSDADHAAPDGGRALMPDLSGRRILIADDSATTQFLLGQSMGALGAICDIVGDGAKAQVALAETRYDLLLLDISLPFLNGAEVLRIQRAREAREKSARVPALAVTAFALQGDRTALLAAGFDGIIAKPLGPARVIAHEIARVLDRASAAQASAHHDAAGQDVVAHLHHLMAISGPDEADELLSRLTHDLSGAQAGMSAAVAANDCGAFRRHCHLIQSVAGILGARDIQDAAHQITLSFDQSDPNDLKVHAENKQYVEIIQSGLSSLLAQIAQEQTTRGAPA